MTEATRSPAKPLQIQLLSTPDEAHDWVAAMLRQIPIALGRRVTLLTDTEEHAHQLRRHCALQLNEPGLLLGVHFSRAARLARTILVRSGLPGVSIGHELRYMHLALLFSGSTLNNSLQYFDAETLHRPGFVEAFARTMSELEQAGVTTRELLELVRSADGPGDDRIRDLTTTWRESELVAAGSDVVLTTGAQLRAAAVELEARPELSETTGPVIALLHTDPTPALLRMLQALLGARVALLDARPPRRGTRAWRDLPTVALADPTESARSATSDLERVQHRLFAAGQLSDADPVLGDGSVTIESHASVNDEVEATAGWILERIDAGVAIEDMLVVATHVDCYATLLADRLSRARLSGRSIPIRVIDGWSATQTPAGAVVTAVLDALEQWLPEARVSPLMTLVRPDEASPSETLSAPLTPSQARDLSMRAGIAGGSAADPRGSFQWTERLELVEARSTSNAASNERNDNERDDEKTRDHQRDHDHRTLRRVRRVLPAIRSLELVAARIDEDAPLPELWSALHHWLTTWIEIPDTPAELVEALDRALRPLCFDPMAKTVVGKNALATIRRAFTDLRISEARPDVPTVAVASPAAAAGLVFEAVRIVGLAEGLAPSIPRDDPVLPDDLRTTLGAILGTIIERTDDRILRQLHAIHRVIGGARSSLAVSAPRQWLDGSDRELSGIILEILWALGTPTGDNPDNPAHVTPAAGRKHRESWSLDTPVLPAALYSRVASRTAGLVPEDWIAEHSALDIVALQRLEHDRSSNEVFGGLDGDLSAVWQHNTSHGITGQAPLSASRLKTLLQCPHRYMFEHILGFKEKPEELTTDRIAPREYGTLVHAAMETIMNAHGKAICAHEGSLDTHHGEGRRLAEREFEQFVASYPLRGTDVRDRERVRFLEDVHSLIDYEWTQPARTFLATEMTFGYDGDVGLDIASSDTDGGTTDAGADDHDSQRRLYLRGKIDRVDRLADGTLAVRDYKSGRVKTLAENAVHPEHDVQIAAYARVLTVTPAPDDGRGEVSVATYVHPSSVRDRERRFESTELRALDAGLDRWLEQAHRLVLAGVFPRTPAPANDCIFCPFRSVCGDTPSLTRRKVDCDQAPGAGLGFVNFRDEERS